MAFWQLCFDIELLLLLLLVAKIHFFINILYILKQFGWFKWVQTLLLLHTTCTEMFNYLTGTGLQTSRAPGTGRRTSWAPGTGRRTSWAPGTGRQTSSAPGSNGWHNHKYLTL